MTTDFKASQVQTSKVIVTGSFAGGSANQLLVYSIDADDSGTPNQGVIDTAVFDTASGIGSDVFLFVSGSTSSRGAAGSYGASVIGGDLHVSGNLTVGGTSPGGGGGGNDYWKSTTAGQIFATGTLAAITGTLRASFLSSSNGLSVTGTFTHGTSTSAVGTNSHAQGDSSTANGNASHAEGTGTNSYGAGSHAEGNTTTAGGNYSHAEGQSTNSSAPYSHAEGYGTYLGTGADWAHVEGYESTAYGRASHAEGYQTTAGNGPEGEYSHSEGYQTQAYNKYAHSEGDGTAALGSGSHTEGLATRAGLWGWPIVSIDTSAQVPYAIFGVSSGLFALDLSGEFGGADVITDAGATYSIVNINWPGGTTTYVTASSAYGFAGPNGSYGAYLGTSIAGVTNQTTFGAVQIAGKNSHTEGSGSISIGEYSHAEGESSVSFSTGSHAEGYYSISRGNYSHSEGSGTQAGGVYSHAEGSSTKAYGGAAHSEGDSTCAGRQGYIISSVDIVSQPGYGIYEIATSYEDVSSQFGSADILIEHIDGNIKKYGYVSSSYDSIAINTYVTASDIFGVGSFYGTDGVKFGIITDISAVQLVRADSYVGAASHSEGVGTVSYGYASHAEGTETSAYGYASHAEGILTIAADYGSHAEGYLTTGSGQYSHAEGSGSIAFASASHAGGIFTIASGSGQTVFGKYNKRNNSDSLFVIGSGDGDLDANRNDILLVNSQSVMIGSGTLGSDVFLYVTGVASSKDTAIAGTTVFAGDVAISGTLYGGSPLKIGSSLLITGAVSQGSNAQAVGAYSRAGGFNTIAFAGWSVAEGSNSVAAGLYSHANGSDARSGKRAFELQSIGITSVDVASQPPYAIYKVKNTYSDVTLEFSAYTTIIVFDTASNGGYYDYINSNYDGTNTYVTASDAYGNGTFFATSADKISNGAYVNQPSADQNAGGDSSHAEGYRAVTVGIGSHAEGKETVAVGAYSHAEGVGAVALGNNSHAEGENAISSGDNSHAEGYATIASGTHSHAEGFLSFAKGDYSHAEGRGTQAIGEGSHTEGYVTWAIGPWSHAGGLGTFASGAYQTVVGKYNVSQNDTSLFVIGDGVFVIGDGPNSSNRSDIVRVNSGTLPGSGSFEVTGTVRSTLGFSGSLTHLTDGTSYLIAGNNVTITSESNGAVTIASTGGGSSPEFWFSTGSNEAYTTGSVFINAGANGNQNLIKFDVSGSEFSSLGSNLSYPERGSYIVVDDVPVADASWSPISGTLKIAAASVMASGSGGEVFIFAGDGGYASGSTPVGGIDGGQISLYPGAGGASDDTAVSGGGGGIIAGTAGQGGSGYTIAGAGGFVSFSGGVGGGKSDSNTTDQFTAGAGGPVYLNGGTGGSPFTPGHIDFIGGLGGDVSITGGSGGFSEGLTNSGGQGGAVTIYGGTGGNTTGGGTGGAGGSVIIQPGTPGLDATGQTYNAGNFEVYGGTLPFASASNNASIARFGIASTGSAFPNEFKGFKYIIMNDPVDDPGLGGSAGSAYLDAFLYVSGTIGSKGTLLRGVSIFGGDAVASGTMNLEGGLRTPPTIVTSLPYTASITDYIIAVSASAGPGVALPSMALDGRNYIVKDVSGSAAVDNIVVSVDGGGLVDGASSYTISINRGSATFVYFGTSIGWGVI